ncbi:hypothetical protein MGYG_02482 [Nannizzia gypsea CBS 118893]|uniref:HTH CENPB-type domain-containing protein n=1 Tax=Arthroderma gypseum (strain ATCC MYA-4604 / CBS 118893) TaxID=535722 RepID=E4UMQ4_ARTGP|nr:hypothetical protein MGYG_02482 [Nannizzia gypsea CBS 118893]EFQ99471.1 hypothetical protein MGYG_02482 [Nannizzia gypsea CBS 118893]
MEAAIEDLKSQEVPNFSETAKRYGVNRVTLSRRFKGATVSRAEATSIHRKKLPGTQEEDLLQHIEKLAKEGRAPTPQIIRNLADKLAKEPVGKNWVTRFCNRYKDRIQSLHAEFDEIEMFNPDEPKPLSLRVPSVHSKYSQTSPLIEGLPNSTTQAGVSGTSKIDLRGVQSVVAAGITLGWELASLPAPFCGPGWGISVRIKLPDKIKAEIILPLFVPPELCQPIEDEPR